MGKHLGAIGLAIRIVGARPGFHRGLDGEPLDRRAEGRRGRILIGHEVAAPLHVGLDPNTGEHSLPKASPVGRSESLHQGGVVCGRPCCQHLLRRCPRATDDNQPFGRNAAIGSTVARCTGGYSPSRGGDRRRPNFLPSEATVPTGDRHPDLSTRSVRGPLPWGRAGRFDPPTPHGD